MGSRQIWRADDPGAPVYTSREKAQLRDSASILQGEASSTNAL